MYGSRLQLLIYYEFELLAARSYGMQSDRRVWRTLIGVQTANPAHMQDQ